MPDQPLPRYSTLVIPPCCQGTPHVTCPAPKPVKHRQPGLANGCPSCASGVGAVKLSRHRTVFSGHTTLPYPPSCRLFNQLPAQNSVPTHYPGSKGAGWSHRKEQQAATRSATFSSYPQSYGCHRVQYAARIGHRTTGTLPVPLDRTADS